MIDQYLAQHSLDVSFVQSLGWTWDENGTTIIIPIYEQNGKISHCRYRHLTGEAKFTSDPGSHPSLYCIHKIKKHETVVFCEGEPDCARLWQEGIPAVTGTSGVKTFTPELAKHLTGKTVVLCLDTDKAGQSSIEQYASVFAQVGVSIFIKNIPTPHKDISEYFTAGHTKEDFQALPTFTFDEWIIKKYEETLPVLDNSDFLKKEYPETTWLVKPLVRATGVTFLLGEGGVGKTAISYSLTKAIVDNLKWLDIFETTKTKVLIIDKENEPFDIKRNLFAQGAINPNIFHYSQSETFMFMDQEGNPTTEAKYLHSFVKQKEIGAIVLDSMVDFYQGNENDAIDAARNVLAWRATFPNTSIIVIHHENKPSFQNTKKMAGHRMRGSTHLFNAAQSILSFSILDAEYPERIFVEHTKVRGARKIKPFEMEMVVSSTTENPDDTFITGFKFLAEVKMEKRKQDEALETVLQLLAGDPEKHFTSKDIETELEGTIENIKNIKMALPKLRENSLVAFDISKQPYTYWHLKDGKMADQSNLFSDE